MKIAEMRYALYERDPMTEGKRLTAGFLVLDRETCWDVEKQRHTFSHDGYAAEADFIGLLMPLWLTARNGVPVECPEGRSYFVDENGVEVPHGRND